MADIRNMIPYVRSTARMFEAGANGGDRRLSEWNIFISLLQDSYCGEINSARVFTIFGRPHVVLIYLGCWFLKSNNVPGTCIPVYEEILGKKFM
jgi:hypothetical protein